MDNTKLWKTVLGELELVLSHAIYATFFANSALLSLEYSVVTIGCNNSVSRLTMEGKYYSLIKNSLDKHTGLNTSVIFKILPAKSTTPADSGPLFSTNFNPNQTPVFIKKPQLRPDFTFETFAVSTSNQMAYAAATAVAGSPGTSYNPLFLYGGVGVGKTHLMQAVGNEVIKNRAGQKIIYCMGEEFTNEIVFAIQTKTTQKFKDKYRSATLLLIDDVQFIGDKVKVQEEFFHTFNAVQRSGGQIVLTSDRPPNEIAGLEERLLSRFEGGLLVDVQNPDFELRCAIVRIKALQKGIDLPFKIARLLAANAESIRKLEGLLGLLITKARFNKLPITEEIAKSIIGKPASLPETETQKKTDCAKNCY